VQIPIKHATLGKSGYELLKPGVVSPVDNKFPLAEERPLATKYGYDAPCPVQNIIFDFLAVFTPGKKFFIYSHLSYNTQLSLKYL
jgi:hypothetical protein